jgi:uncharacterized protein with HEPN domain
MPRDPRPVNDAAYLLDMLEAARAVVRFLADKSLEQYQQDELLRSAVERKVEIIGEAARRLSAAFTDSHPAVPWRQIMGTRHVLAHDYDTVDHTIVWRIATVYVPALISQIQGLLPPPPPDPEPDTATGGGRS